MDKNESERIIKETIEYANMEIQKNKKKSRYIIGGILLTFVFLIVSYPLLFIRESPVNYSEGIVSVKIPIDEGVDIAVNLPNYKRATAVLVQTEDNKYDMYMGITHTVATKIFNEYDDSDHLLRAGNGIILDFQSEQVVLHIPNGDENSIQRVYYVNDFSTIIDENPSVNFAEVTDKTLVWER